MVIALAGRRVDAPAAANKRFPASRTEAVKREIAEFLRGHAASALVCAAACGADILALEAAGELGLRRRIVLPYAATLFRASSVADRGGDWGERYDAVLAAVSGAGDLIEYAHDPQDEQTWFKGNRDILEQAQRLAEQLLQDAAALVVWDGESRGADDVTAHFLREAEQCGFGVAQLSTL
jgi:hypothetical protein